MSLDLAINLFFCTDGFVNEVDWFNSRNMEVFTHNESKTEYFMLFYGRESFLSNFSDSDIIIDGILFNCVEQYYQYKKAEYFEDYAIANYILKSKEPWFQKKYGRKVFCFNPREWDKVCEDIMYKGLVAKFTQNNELERKLLAPALDKYTLVEASPWDRKWGIGLPPNDEKASCREKWRGLNLLGQLLMCVRKELRDHNPLNQPLVAVSRKEHFDEPVAKKQKVVD